LTAAVPQLLLINHHGYPVEMQTQFSQIQAILAKIALILQLLPHITPFGMLGVQLPAIHPL